MVKAVEKKVVTSYKSLFLKRYRAPFFFKVQAKFLASP